MEAECEPACCSLLHASLTNFNCHLLLDCSSQLPRWHAALVSQAAAGGTGGDTEILDSDEEEDAAEQAAEEAEVVAQAGAPASAGMSRIDAAV